FGPLAEIAAQAAGTTPDGGGDAAVAAIARLLAGTCGENASLVARRLVGFLGLGPLAGAAEEGPHDLALLGGALAGDGPLVLVIEDMNFAKPPLLRVLEHLASVWSDIPVLLVCTARRELLDAHPNWGSSLSRM